MQIITPADEDDTDDEAVTERWQAYINAFTSVSVHPGDTADV
jgi:hypothetical protein